MKIRSLRFVTAAALASSASFTWLDSRAATLPIPCAAGACGVTGGFVGAGQASLAQAGNKLTINQTTPNVVLNWQSFNISADGSVQFVQPSATAIALNQIFQADAARIFGSLSANGRIFLINQNGIIFGAGAQVNVGSLLASSLPLNSSVVTPGATPGSSPTINLLQPSQSNQATLCSSGGNCSTLTGAPSPGGIWVQQGATLQAADGGQILLFAPQVTNEGTISTPNGQTILGAGTEVYLAASSDPNLRGLLVEIDNAAAPSTTPTVTNGNPGDAGITSAAQLAGQIIAKDGNVTLAGLAVNQLGRVSATTSINENGSIRLQAQTGKVSAGAGGGSYSLGTGGRLILGPNSDTEVTLDTADSATTVDSVTQLKSFVDMNGASIDILNNSVVRATSGFINAAASKTQGVFSGSSQTGLVAAWNGGVQEDGSRIYVAPDALLDVSGASVVLPVSSNVIPVQLRATELENSPVQQNGPLHGETVYVDIRTGTTLANISGEIAAIQRNVVERNLTGGSINFQSQGDAIVAKGAQLNLSGGQIQYTGGVINTSQLLTTTGQLVNIANADPNMQYVGVADSLTIADPKWGVATTYKTAPGVYSPGYIQGMDAGSLQFAAPRFVLDGSVTATTTAGLYQRQPTDLQFKPLTGSNGLYRNYNQVPEGASLTVGSPGSGGTPEYLTQDIVFQSGSVLPDLRNVDGSAFDPLSPSDPLPQTYAASVLRPDLFGPQGFTQITAYADDKIILPSGTALSLPVGGSFNANAYIVDLESSIDIPSGSISATARSTYPHLQSTPGSLILGSGAALTARGEWINDSQALYPGGNTAPLYINGGKISLTSIEGDLTLGAGSLIDVSGGAQLTSSGQLNAGHGGSIQLGATWNSTDPAAGHPLPRLTLGSTLLGYGVYQGGTLSLTASSVCIAASACTGADASELWLSPVALASGGFSAYNVTADRGGLTVAPGTTVVLQQENLRLPTFYAGMGNAPSLTGIATPVLLPDNLRAPVDLTLTQREPANDQDAGNNLVLSTLPSTPSLTIGEGASIRADAGANLSLNSNVRIAVNGSLSAPGGSISLALAPVPGVSVDSYDPTQAIWLGQTGVLDVHGIAQVFTSDTGLRTGTVLPGGTISITARPGSIELLPGSVVDLSGTSAVVDEIPSAAGGVLTRQVASAGGSLNLAAWQNITTAGTLYAKAGIAGPGVPQPQGGSLTISVQPPSFNPAPNGTVLPPTGSHEIIVSQSVAPIVIQPGSSVPDALANVSLVSASAVKGAGFDSLTLQAGALSTVDAPLGEIQFSGNVALNLARQITLDAALYSVSPGGAAQISAPYVQFGNSSNIGYTYPGATSGTGELDVAGQFVELYGSAVLQGIGKASFASTGDLRLRGVVQQVSGGAASNATGSLAAGGTLDLTAQQIYPSTLTTFTISASDSSNASAPIPGTINIHGAQGTNTDLLSAGGTLKLVAGTVVQDGVLRAPFGTIDIEANTIELGAGSVTSTSANGLTVPFGETQGGLDWIYTLPDGGSTLVYGSGGDTNALPPAQRVVLNGAKVDVGSGAVIDVSGGGDLQAFEWVSGTKGTNDVLSQDFNPGQFAVIPTLRANIAPYDPIISAGTNLQPGDSVYLSGAPGLPAGSYMLLPARYALLPGAFLVTQAGPVYQDMQPGQSVSVAGGGTIVSGYRAVAGTSFADSRTSGFLVTPASIVLTRAQYDLTSGNQFFSGQVSGTKLPLPQLPRDSGTLELIATASLSLDGSLRADPGKNGRGGAVDISSSKILVAADATTAPQSGELVLSAASLDAFGAQSLLLGGQRGNGGVIATTASSVTVASGAALTGPEVLLTASQQVTVEGGASITATGSGPQTRSYALSGDGAFLSVSAGPQATVTRTNTDADPNTHLPTAGVLTLASGSSLTANQGSIYLEATQNLVTQGTIAANGGDLALQSTEIVVGAPPAGLAHGTVLAPGLLAGQGLNNVSLVSASTIDFYGSVDLGAHNLTLDAQGISGFGNTGEAATVAVSGKLTLQDTQVGPGSGGVPVTAGTGSGSLSMSAADVEIGAGSLNVTGFQSLALNVQNAVTGTKNGGALSVTGGNLTINATRLTTKAGVNTSFAADGAVALLSPSQRATLTAATDLGGSLSITGASVELGTEIALPSGTVKLVTTGGPSGASSPVSSDLVLDAGASINVAGLVRQYDSVNVATPGGTVRLVSAGGINLVQGSTIDVSPGSGGVGGSVALVAPTGTVNVAGNLVGGGSGAKGATFTVEANSFGNGGFSGLNSTLNSGGFTGGRSFWLKGAGDLEVAAGNNVTAHTVSLEADQGGITVDSGATVDASGDSGGSVRLAAFNNVVVNGSIDAHAKGAGQNGGTVELDTTTGGTLLNSGSVIDVSGGTANADVAAGAGGTVRLRIPQSVVAAAINGSGGVALNGNIVGARQATLEAFKVYDSTSGVYDPGTGAISATVLTAAPGNPLYDDASSFMTQYASKLQQLGQSSAGFVLQPGIEIDNPNGSLELNQAWNLAPPTVGTGWRFGPNGVPGALTLRASGDITFNASLSDGFASTSSFVPLASDSWSYRIAAGADTTAANPLAVNFTNYDPNTQSYDPSNANHLPAVIIAACSSFCTLGSSGRGGTPQYNPVMVRTGNGFIDVSAAGDFVLGSQASMLYTAGVASQQGIIPPGRTGSLQGLVYPANGGDIDISVGGDVKGAASNQFVNAWLWRTQSTSNISNSVPFPSSVAWTVNFQDFQQGIGALGGGNVTVRAAGDIDNFSASIPSIGIQVGGPTMPESVVQVVGGGTLAVAAGGSIIGGSYFVGKGDVSLQADGNINGGVDSSGKPGLAPILGLGASSASITARGAVELSGILNPTLLPTGKFQGTNATYYSTYGADSGVTLMAVGGDVVLANDDGALMSAIAPSFSLPDFTSATTVTLTGGINPALDVLPPNLNAYATSGSVTVGRSLLLSPAPRGNLQLFAEQDVNVGPPAYIGLPGNLVKLIVSDTDPARLPSAAAPQATLDEYAGVLATVFGNPPDGFNASDLYAGIPVHSVEEPNVNPVRIVARTGDVVFPANGNRGNGLWSAKPVDIVAGGDVIDLALVAQNLSPSDVTSITAGGSVLYPRSRLGVGAEIQPNPEEITIDGPGLLEVSAAGTVDLGTSAGITSRGNLVNTSLPAGGAHISVEAGVGPSGPQLAAFISTYIDGSSTFDSNLVSFVQTVTGETDLSAKDAKAIFDGMSKQLQRAFVEDLFFTIVDTNGRHEAKTKDGDFKDAFAAIEKLFPGANPNLAQGETNPYAGDIDLFFSRIYTLSGGDISLLAPGGKIDVGLATPPAGFGPALALKGPADLGIVVERTGNINAFSYGDFQVNQSRVFAADGGRILVWSTEGDIDAGRGSKTSISAPPPTITIDPKTGASIITLSPALTGSGIQALATSPGAKPGDVDLFAPHGVVNADEAGIVAGNLTVAATAVLGTNNISVSGTTVGVPVAVTGLGANVVGASAGAAGAMTSGENGLAANHEEQRAPVADTALSWLDAFILGFGAENCKADDAECMKRAAGPEPK